MTIGEHIQTVRKNKGLSQQQLGELLGVSGSMIGQYENNLRNPKSATLQKIANVLGVSEFYLSMPSVQLGSVIEIENLDALKSLIEQTKTDIAVLENDMKRINSFQLKIKISKRGDKSCT